jgi:hypothetical protein
MVFCRLCLCVCIDVYAKRLRIVHVGGIEHNFVFLLQGTICHVKTPLVFFFFFLFGFTLTHSYSQTKPVLDKKTNFFFVLCIHISLY